MFFNRVGFRQEDESCPYAWLPFTGERHRKNVQKQHHQFHIQDITGHSSHSFFFFILYPVLSAAMLPKIHYTKINITFLEKFGPVFASEGGSASLTATMTLEPNLANLQPEAQWYRDGNCYEVALYD